MKPQIFIDTSYTIAAASRFDSLHNKAIHYAKEICISKIQCITTQAVIIETGNALSGLRNRKNAINIITTLENDPNIIIMPVSEPIYIKAFQLFSTHPDKEWGLADCISFIVMQDYGITDALTADLHFQQAGFNPLLLNKEFG